MRSVAPVTVRLTTTPPAPWPGTHVRPRPTGLRWGRARVVLAVALTAALAVPVWQSLHPRDGVSTLSAPVVVEDGSGSDQGVVAQPVRAPAQPVDPAGLVVPAAAADRGRAASAAAAGSPGGGPDSCVAPCSTAQVVSVQVLPGPFTVEAGTVVLRGGDEAVGTTRATVTDLRGSAVPWTLSLRWDGTARDASGQVVRVGALRVQASCTKTAGPLTVVAERPATVTRSREVALCRTPSVAAGSLAGGLVDVALRVQARGFDDDGGDDDALEGVTLGLTWVLSAV